MSVCAQCIKLMYCACACIDASVSVYRCIDVCKCDGAYTNTHTQSLLL